MGRSYYYILLSFVVLLSWGFLSAASQIANPAKAGLSSPNKSGNIPGNYYQFNTGQIEATVSNNGIMGISSETASGLCDGEACARFMSPPGSGDEYLFSGGIWIGGINEQGDTLVSISVDGWSQTGEEFTAIEPGKLYKYVGDITYQAIMSDTQVVSYDMVPSHPLGLRLSHRIYAWNSEPENMCLIHDLTITNISGGTLNGCFAGIFLDGDIYNEATSSGWVDDMAGSLPDYGIAYIIDNDGDPKTFGEPSWTATSVRRALGLKILQVSQSEYDTSFNWWCPNADTRWDFGPTPADENGDPIYRFLYGNLGSPITDVDRYNLMSHPQWDYDMRYLCQGLEGWYEPPTACSEPAAESIVRDPRFLMSVGPFNLPPDSSIRIIFTTFTGRDVHVYPDNFQNNWDWPNTEDYYNNLDFSDLINNSLIADSLSELLIDPDIPVTGLDVVHNDRDSTVIEWDPFVYDGVEGYGIYLEEIPDVILPYPGVYPPWLNNSILDIMRKLTDVDRTYRYNLGRLDTDKIYRVCVANRTAEGYGQRGMGTGILPRDYMDSPTAPDTFVYFADGQAATIEWTAPENVAVDHYNIFKFPGIEEAESIYHAFYDTIRSDYEFNPVDSFHIDGTWYYYYAIEPYATVTGDLTSFTENTVDRATYVISAVAANGNESHFTQPIRVFHSNNFVHDILLIHCAGNSVEYDKVICDSVVDFYDRVLTDLGYDYEIYDYADTFLTYGDICKPEWWLDLLPYKLIIVDGGLSLHIPRTSTVCNNSVDFTRYLEEGGRILFCGPVTLENSSHWYVTPLYCSARTDYNDFYKYFGIDSVLKVDLLDIYSGQNYPIDTILGLVRAEGESCGWRDVDFSGSLGKVGEVGQFWDTTTMFAPATFIANDRGEVIYRAVSKYPESSMVDSDAFGIKTITGNAVTYLFGFHLWYMNEVDARNLILSVYNDTGPYRFDNLWTDPAEIDRGIGNSPDPVPGKIYFSMCDGEYDIRNIDAGSLRINGELIPENVLIIYGSSEEDSWVKMEFDWRQLSEYYPDFLKSDEIVYSVSGKLNGDIEFSLSGRLPVGGAISGDANGDHKVNIVDIGFLVNYIFFTGPAPEPMLAGDADGSGEVNITDASYLVNYIFNNGPPPVYNP